VHPGTRGDTPLARSLDDLRLRTLGGRHGVDDTDGAIDDFLVDVSALRKLRELRGQLIHQRAQPAHLVHLLHLRLEVLQVEAFAALHLLRELLGFFDIDVFARFFHQAQHIAHA
jgi:hypothetical protein